MILLPKEPIARPPYIIYRGNDPESRQFPLLKTEDFIDNMGPLSTKLGYALKQGLKIGLLYSLFDVTMVMRIQERKAQIARTAYFTVPIVSATVGWMGALEIAKKVLGKDRYMEAQAVAATVPAAVWTIWKRNPLSICISWAIFASIGTMYQASVEYNMNISLYPNSHYNPNEPQGFYDQNRTYFGEVGRPSFWHLPVHTNLDQGPSWKKWEEKTE